MTIPSALTLKFKIFQKVELIDLCTERLNCWNTSVLLSDQFRSRLLVSYEVHYCTHSYVFYVFNSSNVKTIFSINCVRFVIFSV